jgi:hypothetical protein
LIRLFFDRGGSFHPKRDALVSSKYTNVIASTTWRSDPREIDARSFDLFAQSLAKSPALVRYCLSKAHGTDHFRRRIESRITQISSIEKYWTICSRHRAGLIAEVWGESGREDLSMIWPNSDGKLSQLNKSKDLYASMI